MNETIRFANLSEHTEIFLVDGVEYTRINGNADYNAFRLVDRTIHKFSVDTLVNPTGAEIVIE